MTTETSPFFLVWCPQGQTAPRHRHETQFQAEREANRLARENPGREFFVISPVYSALQPAGLTTKRWSPIDEDIPF